MYLGKVVELAGRDEIYDHPKHPYTKALLSAIPVPDPDIQAQRRLVELKGEIPSPISPPSACRFHTRCPIARAPGICSEQEPRLEEKAPRHLAACHFSHEVS
jgi:oligopeptide/dipeptide ABC transporter ATP-binding protein